MRSPGLSGNLKKSSKSDLGRYSHQGARRLLSNCNNVADLGQFDMAVSIGDRGWSFLVGRKGFFSKGCARVSLGKVAVVWEDGVDCHFRNCDVDGFVDEDIFLIELGDGCIARRLSAR